MYETESGLQQYVCALGWPKTIYNSGSLCAAAAHVRSKVCVVTFVIPRRPFVAIVALIVCVSSSLFILLEYITRMLWATTLYA